MSYKYQENPMEMRCFRTCKACLRCEDKGRYAKCGSCSGRRDDTKRKWDPYDVDDRCRCSEGILQLRLQSGSLIQTKYPHNPYEGRVTSKVKGEDEKEWDAYVYSMRERMDDANFNPIEITEG